MAMDDSPDATAPLDDGAEPPQETPLERGHSILGPLAAYLGLAASPGFVASEQAKRMAIHHEIVRARRGLLPPGELPPKETTPLDPSTVSRITAKVRGKAVLSREISPGQGTQVYEALLAMSEEHGRTLVVTCHMRDGSKQRYRGHGTRLAAKTTHVPSFVVDPAPEVLHEPPHQWTAGELAAIQTKTRREPVLVMVLGWNATGSKVRYRLLDDDGAPTGPSRSVRPHRLSIPEVA